MRYERLHGAAVLEGSDEHQPRLAAGEQILEFLAALAIHRPGAGDRLDEQEPVLGGVVDDDIGNFGGSIQSDSQLGQAFGLHVNELVFGVANVNDHATGSEGRTEVFNDRLNERILATW